MAANVVPIKPADLVKFDFDGAQRALWVSIAQRPCGPHNFSLAFVRSLHALTEQVWQAGLTWDADGRRAPIDYLVLRSEHPDYFSVGGDLAYFQECIAAKDWEALHHYATLCLDVTYRWAVEVSQRATTVALVQGRALGGGFETALSADILVAEEQADFGFPEILFGLFPCSGGMSFLGRRIGVHRAERMMSDGRIYTATELHQLGVVDEICGRGEGDAVVHKLIREHASRRRARLALQRARHRMLPFARDEMAQVVRDWVDTAKSLTEQESRVMDTLARLQGGSSVRRR